MTTIGEVVSRVRQAIKAEVQDAFITDRYLYSLILKNAQLFMRRQDNANKLMKFNSVWQALPFIELIEVIRTVSSIDASIECQPTNPGTYTSMTKTTSHKYNKTKYFWFLNDYLYLPNVNWDAIKLEGVFEGDISQWSCDISDDCTPRYLQNIYIPEFLFAEIETQVLNQLLNTQKTPMEDSDNKININR